MKAEFTRGKKVGDIILEVETETDNELLLMEMLFERISKSGHGTANVQASLRVLDGIGKAPRFRKLYFSVQEKEDKKK